jgi:hypothetical protein
MHPKNALLFYQPVFEENSEMIFICRQNSNVHAVNKKIKSYSVIGKRGI